MARQSQKSAWTDEQILEFWKNPKNRKRIEKAVSVPSVKVKPFDRSFHMSCGVQATTPLSFLHRTQILVSSHSKSGGSAGEDLSDENVASDNQATTEPKPLCSGESKNLLLLLISREKRHKQVTQPMMNTDKNL